MRVLPSQRIAELHRTLSQKFPGARIGLNTLAAPSGFCVGVPQIDKSAPGGLPKGALAEIVCGDGASGSATLMRQLLFQAAAQNQIVTVIDGTDSLDVTQLDEAVLSKLLWIRCHAADKALKAADLVLRDRNLPFVLLDLKMNPQKQLQRIPATTWHRLQRLAHETDTVCAVLTPGPMIGPAQKRITLLSRFSLEDLEREAGGLLGELKVQISGTARFGGPVESFHQPA